VDKLPDNITLFARLLRKIGFDVPTRSILSAIEAVSLVGVSNRDDFRTALKASLVSQPGQRLLFDQLFDSFWQNPDLANKALAALLPQTLVPPRQLASTPGARRVADALSSPAKKQAPLTEDLLEIDARETMSDIERLVSTDFEQMSVEETAQARAALSNMAWSLPRRLSRRTDPARNGLHLDLRRTLRRAMKYGGTIVHLQKRRPRMVERPLVVLCDISGSMSVYARMCLFFIHGITQQRRATRATTHTFLFGTQLTNISRALRQRDPDEALSQVARLTPDRDGGTRIGASLESFHRLWSRRVLTQGATVLLITDGLERDDNDVLDNAARNLGRAAKRVIWLNPLLRYDAFAPKAQGIRTLLKHVTELRPVHNLASIASLADALRAPGRTLGWKQLRPTRP
jgi:uncharacterized protein with von Willebrand factor type A (vWA) domain